MLELLRRIVRAINRRAGLGLQRTCLYRAAKADWGAPAAGTDRNVTWELLSPEHAATLMENGWFSGSDGFERLHRGDVCYTASLDGRLAHYSWVQRSGSHPITDAGAFVRIARGDFWIYDCETLEWARGRGIYAATLVRILNDHFRIGYSTAWIYAPVQNRASRRGIQRAGFNSVATVRALRIGRRFYCLGWGGPSPFKFALLDARAA